MKTPEEIKNGLKCCTNDAGACHESCPYFNSLSNGVDCASKMHDDAIAYIQQLEAELSAEKDQHQYIVDGALTLADEAAKFERERDFLLKYLTDSHWAVCDICKHEPEEGNIHACKRIREVKGAPCFEWRGLPEV